MVGGNANHAKEVSRALTLGNGAGEMNRTPDLRITNALLYQLSYTGFFSPRSNEIQGALA
jgi:hypothetical protein